MPSQSMKAAARPSLNTLQMQQQPPHRLSVRRSRTEHRVANPNELSHPPYNQFSLAAFASTNSHAAERNRRRV